MTAALIGKEIRQHWWALALIGLFSLLGIGWVLLFTVMMEQGGSQLFSLRLHAMLLAICALILGNRLVVAEYGSQTQIFLESLPLPRLRIVLVKFFIGLTVMLACAETGLLIAMVLGARTEVYTPRFVGILHARYLVYTVFVYCLFFGMGFLGRYRFAAYALLIGGVAVLLRTRDILLHELPPIHLVGETFPFEREVYPVTSLIVTGGLALGFFLLGITLAVTREGSVSSLLGEKMSYRDKISLTALSLTIIVALNVIDRHREKPPYEMAGGISAEGTRLAAVTVAPESGPAARLANRLAADLDELADYLALERLPPVFVIERPDLDPDQFEYGWLADAEGIILRTAHRDPEWEYERCVERITGDVVEAATRGRAMKEERFWVIDGFTLLWPFRGGADEPLDRDRHLLLRALHGTEMLGGIREPEDLERWFSHQVRVGHEITAGIGWSMLRVLEREAGPEAARNFLRSVLAEDLPPNALSAWHDLRRPVAARFRDHTGMDLGEFLTLWNAELDLWRGELAGPLAEIPRLTGELDFVGEPGATSQARYRFAPPPDANTEYFRRPVLLYGETAPFTTWLPEETTKRQPLDAAEVSEAWLRESWGAGVAVTWTFAADSPALRCRVISGWQHTRVP